MVSSIDLECPCCESVYTLTSEEANVLILYQCPECRQYSAYLAGHMIMLDKDIMDKGAYIERRSYIIKALQLWTCRFADNILRNVSKVINVNVDVGLRDTDLHDPSFMQGVEKTSKLSAPEFTPTVLWADAPPITDKEIQDFVSIDLNLIDRKHYFDRFFSDRND